MACPSDWPEPIVRVQSLSEKCGGKGRIPERYVKPVESRPWLSEEGEEANIPVIDLGEEGEIGGRVAEACREWGFLQVVNHGVRPELMDAAQEVWRQFFHQPMEVKQAYANSPTTYEGYGSRLGIEKGAILDWSDYYFLHYLPCNLRDVNKWPSLPISLRFLFLKKNFYLNNNEYLPYCYYYINPCFNIRG